MNSSEHSGAEPKGFIHRLRSFCQYGSEVLWVVGAELSMLFLRVFVLRPVVIVCLAMVVLVGVIPLATFLTPDFTEASVNAGFDRINQQIPVYLSGIFSMSFLLEIINWVRRLMVWPVTAGYRRGQ